MPSSPPPIPREIWERILAFLHEGKTGSFTVHVNQGHGATVELREHYRAGQPERNGGSAPTITRSAGS